MSNWIEQAPTEKNEFKIGDRIKDYDGTGQFEGEVTQNDGGDMLEYNSQGTVMEVHYKCARLLKKKEARMFAGFCTKHRTDTCGIQRSSDCEDIIVREVLQD